MNTFKKLLLLVVAGSIVHADLCLGAKRKVDDSSKKVDNRDTKKHRVDNAKNEQSSSSSFP